MDAIRLIERPPMPCVAKKALSLRFSSRSHSSSLSICSTNHLAASANRPRALEQRLATTSLKTGASNRFFARKVCHYIFFALTSAKSSERPRGTPIANAVRLRSKVRLIAITSEASSTVGPLSGIWRAKQSCILLLVIPRLTIASSFSAIAVSLG